MSWKLPNLYIIVALLSFTAFGLTPDAASAQNTELVEALHSGGYVLYLRHTETHSDQSDAKANFSNPTDCENQRLLNDVGEDKARKLGDALRTFEVPIGKVYSSIFCRAQKTAELMGYKNIETTLDISEGGLVVPPKENRRRKEALAKMFGTKPEAGTNTLLVAHKPNLVDVLAADAIDAVPGEMFVMQPQDGDPGYKLIARVKHDEWIAWAAAKK